MEKTNETIPTTERNVLGLSSRAAWGRAREKPDFRGFSPPYVSEPA
jgi:hypothetical protein